MRNFLFDRAWVIEQAKYFDGAVSQLYVSAILPTRYGDVELYGFIDELKRDVVYDIKTTKARTASESMSTAGSGMCILTA